MYESFSVRTTNRRRCNSLCICFVWICCSFGCYISVCSNCFLRQITENER